MQEHEARGEALRVVTMRALARKAGGRSPSTVTRKFSDWYEVCAELMIWLAQQGKPIPPQVRAHATIAQTRARHEATKANRPRTLEQLQGDYQRAIASADAGLVARTADALVQRLTTESRDHSGSILAYTRDVLERAEWINATSPEGRVDLEACLRVIDAAVDVHRKLSAGGRDERAHLGEIIQLKRRDRDYSRKLQLHMRDEIARFHIARAEALLGVSPAREVQSLETFVERITERDADKPDTDTSIMLFARHCAMRIAYPDQLSGDQWDSTQHTLLTWFDREDPAALEAWRACRALAALMTPGTQSVRAVELLRAARFASVGDFVIARRLTEWAELSDGQLHRYFTLDADSGPPDPAAHNPDLIRVHILERAYDYYDKVQKHCRPTGCAGRLAAIAAKEARAVNARIADLLTKYPEDEFKGWDPGRPQNVEKIREQIGVLLIQAMVGVPLDNLQMARLSRDLDAIQSFLKQPEIYGVEPTPTEQPPRPTDTRQTSLVDPPTLRVQRPRLS